MDPTNGISEPAIATLVHRFYGKARRDPVIGPLFEEAVEDWDAHLAKLCDFWSSVMLTTGRYKGNPVAKHVALSGIEPPLFERWLTLFNETASELFDDAVSDEFRAKAARIAESLQLALFYRPDRPWPPQPAT